MVASLPSPVFTNANPSIHVLMLDPTVHDGAGPGTTRTFDLAKRMVAAGHQVTVLTTTWGWDPADTATQRAGAIRTAAGVRLQALAVRSSPGMTLRATDVSRYMRWAAVQMWRVPDVDVVIATTEPAGLLPIVAAFALWRGIPLAAEARTLPPDAPPSEAPRPEKMKAWLGRALRRLSLRLPRKIFATSPAVTESLTAHGVRTDRQVQTILGCDNSLFALPAGRDNTFLQDFPDLAGRPLLVFAGHFTPDRDLIAVINLAAAMREWSPDVVVVMCGDGPSRAMLVDHARAIGVHDTGLRIVAPISRRQLPDLLAAAAMVLSVPSRNDTAGGFFDALAAGRPQLAFGSSWQRTLVESRGAGFGLPAGEPRAVAREVVEILRDTDGLRRAGQQAAALAAGRFSIDRIIAEQRAVVETLVAESPRAEVLRHRALIAKRITDIVVAASALILLVPVIAVLIVIIAVKMGWPPIIATQRLGLRGRPFKSFRFRTRADANDSSGAPLRSTDRTTSLGQFLSASGLAVIPELLNVLRGAMSLVGPAPLPAAYASYYAPSQRRRHDMRPGLTGLAQVEGRNVTSWEDMFARDVSYIDEFTFGLDCKILARTILNAIRGEHISVPHGLPAFDAIMARREGAEDI